MFQAGFNWKVIENKWDGFEEAFDSFDVGRCAFMDDEKFDALLQDTRIVRNGTKIAAVRDNAAFLMELRDEGGAGQVLGGLALDRLCGPAGHAGQAGLAAGGHDRAIRDALYRARQFHPVPGRHRAPDRRRGGGQTAHIEKAMTAVQQAFNTWMDQSNRSLTEISRVLAMSL